MGNLVHTEFVLTFGPWVIDGGLHMDQRLAQSARLTERCSC